MGGAADARRTHIGRRPTPSVSLGASRPALGRRAHRDAVLAAARPPVDVVWDIRAASRSSASRRWEA